MVVLEGAARPGASEDEASAAVRVVHAPGEGDETVVAFATDASEAVIVVSADRALADRCRAVGADVVGLGWLLDRLGH